MVDLYAPLNARQVEVLRWIVDGCPDGVMEGHIHKTVAAALQARRLVKVSRKGGVWRAEPTDIGRHYAAHGSYPDRLARSVPQRAARQPRPGKPGPSPKVSKQRTVEESPLEPERAYGPPKPTPQQMAISLVEMVVQSGGSLAVDPVRSQAHYDWLVAESKHAPNLPSGKQLRCKSTGGWGEDRRLRVYLDEDFAVRVAERPVPVSSRVLTYHQVVAAYRDDPDRHEVSTGSLSRASRVLHALATEAERRGYSVTGRRKTEEKFSLTDGQMQIKISSSSYKIRIREEGAPGGAPLPYSFGPRKLPRWRAAKKNAFVPTGKLRITIEEGYSRDGRPTEFRDTQKASLEERLPAALRELEIRALEDDWRRQEEERKVERRRRQWELAMDQAKEDFREARRAEILAGQIKRWRQAAEVDAYISAMHTAIEGLADDESRADASRWLTWISAYRERLDPLHGHLEMPEDVKPSREDLMPFLRGWSPYGPDAYR
jgi:hypothetical protein